MMKLPAYLFAAVLSGACLWQSNAFAPLSGVKAPPSYLKQSYSIRYAAVQVEEKAEEKIPEKEVIKVEPVAPVETEDVKILGGKIPYSELTIGVLKETTPGENRVSQTPDTIRQLVKAGFNVAVQEGGT